MTKQIIKDGINGKTYMCVYICLHKHPDKHHHFMCLIRKERQLSSSAAFLALTFDHDFDHAVDEVSKFKWNSVTILLSRACVTENSKKVKLILMLVSL